MKQTTKNPSKESCSLGFKLMLACLSTFPPGPLLRDHLMAHCADQSRNHPEPDVKDLADRCLHTAGDPASLRRS